MPKTTSTERMINHCQNKTMTLNLKRRKAKEYLISMHINVSTLRDKNRLKVQAWRGKNKVKEVLKVTPVTKNGFKILQGFGKAMKRLKRL